MITAKAFGGKHYAVYGLARSGLSTAGALLASGARVTAWDAKVEARAKAPAGTEIAYLDEADLTQFDSLVVTPGLPLNRHPIAQRAREAGVEIIGDIELFARARPELPLHKVVGITGTNGKSTTTALIHHILKTAGLPTTMGGNIGLPILSQDPLPEGGVYVLELSSYQIDLTQSLNCDVAVLLNITPDHLDRYESFEAYAASKARLFEMQLETESHAAVIAEDDDQTRAIASGLGEKGFWLRNTLICVRGSDVGEQASLPTLQGPHNAQNIACAIAVCRHLGVAYATIVEGLETYAGLPHRMERVREMDGILFVNDSKATNPTATAPALAAFPSIRWILGGQAKTDNLDECAPHFGHVRSAYTIGEAGELFARLLAPHMPVTNCETLENALNRAAKDSQSGDTVLLSPACASFDQFKDFEQRGDRFRDLVGAL
ncbi:UDP-N-acetylmuramoyl-L-alanine--D-glutamate ligase [Sphingomonas sediminicola]|uniref:UDP-N-acetylmuramoyl-L-alanine--D-glutamate ligase n=1 Tax=Sphingomonas sediminicola TaxID=386874 RepID=UPI003CE82C43